jgi:oligopeptide/dipeptide ABC transporter ATP-binding protein
MYAIATALHDIADEGTILSVRDLAVEVGGRRAVDGVSFSLARGGTFCLVGESGCGKSLTCRAVLGQLPANINRVAGSIAMPAPEAARPSEAPRIAMIYQDSTASLNPVLRVGEQIAEPLEVHFGLSAAAARQEALRFIDAVGIPDARRRFNAYPHELSGGTNQRVAIARALACRSEVLLADEPTTALDVTVQAQILDLLAQVQREAGLSLLLVTHDLGVVAEIAKDMAVMYAGRIVEAGPVEILFSSPAHPYTAALLACLPSMGEIEGPLAAIPGVVPPLGQRPAGCGFAPRCSRAGDLCRQKRPELRADRLGTMVACHFPLVDAA